MCLLVVWKTDGRLPGNLINFKVSSFFSLSKYLSSLDSTAVVLSKARLVVILNWSVSHYKVKYVLQWGGQVMF